MAYIKNLFHRKLKAKRNYTDIEILELFNKYYFLETSTEFIQCVKESTKPVEIISKADMEYLNMRYQELLTKKRY